MRAPHENTTTHDPRAGSRRARTAALTALACTGVLATSGAGSAVAAPVSHPVLDTADPVAVSVQGTRVAWLRATSKPTSSGAARTADIVIVDKPGDAPRTLAVKAPAFADDLELGTDSKGRVVLTIGSRSGTYVTRTDGSGGISKLRGQTSKDESFVMRTGAIAFTRVSGGSTTVRTAPAAGRRSSVLYRVPQEYAAVQLALGKNRSVALHAERPRDVGIGNIVWLLRPGKDVKRLTSQSNGGASDNGIGSINSTANGQRFGVTRWNVGGGHPSDVQRFSAATGKQTSSRKATVDAGADAVDEQLFDDGRSVISTIEAGDCNAPGTPGEPDLPACLGLGFVG